MNKVDLKKLENRIDKICKKGGYPTHVRPSKIAKKIKDKFQIVKVESDSYPYINTVILPKDVRVKYSLTTTISENKLHADLNYLYNNPHVSLNYDIDMLIEGPEYPFVRGDIIINKNIDMSKNKLIMIYLDHPAIDKRTVLYPGIESLKDLKNIIDCFIPYQCLIFKINIDDDGIEHVEYSKLALSDNDFDDFHIGYKYLDIRNYELYTIKETDANLQKYKHYDYINNISSLVKRGYDMYTIEDSYNEFKNLYTKEVW